jgi:hypothetical protein
LTFHIKINRKKVKKKIKRKKKGSDRKLPLNYGLKLGLFSTRIFIIKENFDYDKKHQNRLKSILREL